MPNGPETGPEPEDVTEEEKKEPTLEEQTEIYAEMFGADAGKILEQARSLQAEMSEKEKKELTMLIFAPKRFSLKEAWKFVKSNQTLEHLTNMGEVVTKGETEKAVVAFARFSQEPDEDSLGKNAKSAIDWEKTDQEFMSPRLRIIAGELYRRVTGKQLDEKNPTMSPGSRVPVGRVPVLFNQSGLVVLSAGDPDPEHLLRYVGVRRVVSKELES